MNALCYNVANNRSSFTIKLPIEAATRLEDQPILPRISTRSISNVNEREGSVGSPVDDHLHLDPEKATLY